MQAQPRYDEEHSTEPIFGFCLQCCWRSNSGQCTLPSFGLFLSPMIANAAMTFSSVSVHANALRLRKVSLEWITGNVEVRSARQFEDTLTLRLAGRPFHE